MSVNTYLVECTHEDAIQAFDNSHFINRVGDGIQLDVGDTVSVHSAYIHEIGSGSDTIEFSGRDVTTQQSVLETVYTDASIPLTQKVIAYEDSSVGASTVTITRHPYLDQQLVQFGGYLKNGNTEIRITSVSVESENDDFIETLTLTSGLVAAVSTYDELVIENKWLLSNPQQYQQRATSSHPYTMKDTLSKISYSYYKSADGQNCMMLPRLYFANQPFPDDEFDRYPHIAENAAATTDPDDGVPPNFLTFADKPQDTEPYLSLYRRKHDASRYKIFVMKSPIPSVQSTRKPVREGMQFNILQLDDQRDIALREFEEYRETAEFSVPEGYNSPANIATDITAQLHQCPELVTKYATVANQDPTDTATLTTELSVVTPTPTFKPFGCSSVSNYNRTTYQANVSTVNNNQSTYNSTKTYLQAYRHIGVYDPVLFAAGRQLAREGYKIMQNITTQQRATADIVIEMEYTHDNLLKWKAVFDAQSHRSDLIFGTNITTDNCRFIHMNPGNFARSSGTTQTTKFMFDRLGDDGLLPQLFTAADNVGESIQGRTGQSARQFVEYQPANADNFLAVDDSALQSGTLCYGFAKPVLVGLKYYIAFKTQQVGGIQNKIDLPIDVDVTNDTRFAGWDWHFSSYGNDAMVLWSGYVADGPVRNRSITDAAQFDSYADYRNVWTNTLGNLSQQSVAKKDLYLLYAYVDWVMLGADNPLINFTSNESRFAISNLHTAPRQGNIPLAGRSEIGTVTFPDNPDSKNLVYRINPLLNRGLTGAGFFNYNPEVRQLPPKPNSNGFADVMRSDSLLKKWTIFDSQTGIMVEQFGCDEANWASSMWFKLGFDYSQLNGGVINTQGRATNANSQLMPVMTNADVNATQALAIMVNAYDGAQYTLQSPISALQVSQHDATGFQYTEQLIPRLTEVQTSTALTAARKPEKQIYGYYTIRSSLVDNSQFFSEDVMLPVISVLSKNYTGADFVFSDATSDAFSVTKAVTITEIATSIFKPDGKLARTDPRSAVIYKINKAFNYNPNVVQQLLAQQAQQAPPRPTPPS